MRTPVRALGRSLLLAAALAGGCGRGGAGGGPEEGTSEFRHKAPHGGTMVALGDDFNLELFRDAETGVLSAYILDDDAEDFVRSADSAIAIQATEGGRTHDLILSAVANPATGETVGDSALFQTRADWLRGSDPFAARLARLTVHGSTFTNIRFNVPASEAVRSQ